MRWEPIMLDILSFEKVNESLKKLKDAEVAEDLLYHGEICLRYGRLPLSLKAFQKIAKINAENFNAYLNLARIFLHLKDYEETLKNLEKVYKIYPSSFEGYILYKILNERQTIQTGQPLFADFKTSGDEVSSLEIKIQLELSAQDEQISACAELVEKTSDPIAKYFLKAAKDRKALFLEMENQFVKLKDTIKIEGEPVYTEIKEAKDMLKDVLEEMVKVKSIISAAVITQGGKIIQSAYGEAGENQRIYSEVTPSLSFIDKWIKENKFSSLDLCVLSFEETLIFLQKVLKEYWICTIASGRVNFGAVKYNVEKNKDRIEDILKSR